MSCSIFPWSKQRKEREPRIFVITCLTRVSRWHNSRYTINLLGERRKSPSTRSASKRLCPPRGRWTYSASQISSMETSSLFAPEGGKTSQKGPFNTAYSNSALVFSASKSSYVLVPKGVAAPLL